MNWKEFLKKLGKNVASFLAGALIGGFLGEVYTLYIWVPIYGPDLGLAIIAFIAPMMVLFGLIGAVLGGLLGLGIYRFYKWKKVKYPKNVQF